MDIIKIKDKPIKNYIIAGMQSISKYKGVKILARGRKYNGVAIDVALILLRGTDMKYDIKIYDEEFDGRKVSSIEITLN